MARARHILVGDVKFCEDIKKRIDDGEISFEDAAIEYSKCPSGKDGGDLGEFGRGVMVPEFDRVVFEDAIGVVHGPIRTQFGYHLLEIISRD